MRPLPIETLQSDAAKILKSLRSNAGSGVTSFTIFEQGNGETRDHRNTLHLLVSQRQAVVPFDHILRSMLNLAVMDISRMTDNPGTDRLSLKRLVKLVDGRKADFEDCARHWHDGALGYPNPLAEGAAAKVAEEWDLFHSKFEALLASDELKRVRKLRDSELAHSLGKSIQLPIISDLKHVLVQLAEIVSSASFAIEGLEWDIADYVESRSEHARRFWDSFEKR
jgi:hypothetical protein